MVGAPELLERQVRTLGTWSLDDFMKGLTEKSIVYIACKDDPTSMHLCVNWISLRDDGTLVVLGSEADLLYAPWLYHRIEVTPGHSRTLTIFSSRGDIGAVAGVLGRDFIGPDVLRDQGYSELVRPLPPGESYLDNLHKGWRPARPDLAFTPLKRCLSSGGFPGDSFNANTCFYFIAEGRIPPEPPRDVVLGIKVTGVGRLWRDNRWGGFQETNCYAFTGEAREDRLSGRDKPWVPVQGYWSLDHFGRLWYPEVADGQTA